MSDYWLRRERVVRHSFCEPTLPPVLYQFSAGQASSGPMSVSKCSEVNVSSKSWQIF